MSLGNSGLDPSYHWGIHSRVSRRKPESRCIRCLMKVERCLCGKIAETRAALKKTISQHEILVLMHFKEARLPSNTGRLAQLLMPDTCRVEIRGKQNTASKSCLDPSRAILIFPTKDSLELPKHISEFKNALSVTPCAQLVFPDGSWRQASKVPKRIAALQEVPAFHLSSDLAPTKYQLRNEPKTGGLATFEAIARVLGMTEGLELQEKLESFFEIFVHQSLATRAGHQ